MEDIYKAIQLLQEDVEAINRQLELLKKRPGVLLKEDWIDGQDVMLALHISKRSLQTMRDSGKLTPTRILKKYFYKVSDVDALLENNYIRYHKT